LYKASKDDFSSGNEKVAEEQTHKWVYVGRVRAHSHDVRALTMAVPVCKEGLCFLYIAILPSTGLTLISVLLFSRCFTRGKGCEDSPAREAY
jgi:hypothetical protein